MEISKHEATGDIKMKSANLMKITFFNIETGKLEDLDETETIHNVHCIGVTKDGIEWFNDETSGIIYDFDGVEITPED